MLETINFVILIAAGLVAVSVFTSLISFRVGAPLLLVFLLVGLAAGEDGPGGIEFADASAAYFIGSIALAIILFDSGFETRFSTLRMAAAPAVTLATAGVVLTAAIVGTAAHLLFGWSLLEGLLLGAIVGSTDAAAVFFLLRVGGVHLREMISATLEVESGSNDPMAIFLTFTLVSLVTTGLDEGAAASALAIAFIQQMGIGFVFGLAGGYVIVQIVNRIKLEPALYPIVVLALALVLFAATSMVGGSGFLAVYVAGILCGNVRIRQQPALKRFQGGMTWLGQIGMFVTLGLLATPSQFGHVAVAGLALALTLIFVARPFAVWICLLPFGFTRSESAFVSWVGLRGAVSILLAILPLIHGLPNAQAIFNVTFLIVLTSLVLQGWTIKPMARWLKLIVPPRIGPVERMELELPGGSDHEIVSYRVHPDSAVARGDRIPRWARPVLIMREGRSIRVQKAGRPQPNDQIYILTSARQVPVLDALFAAPAEVAHDPALFGDFQLDPNAPLADVGAIYGFRVVTGDQGLTIRELMTRELGDDIEPTDRVPYGSIDFIVRQIDEEHGITDIGLAVEHIETDEPNLPFFFSRDDIADFSRRRYRRLRARLRRRGQVRRQRSLEKAASASQTAVPSHDDGGTEPLSPAPHERSQETADALKPISAPQPANDAESRQTPPN
ncbi:potassium/proton antiporter [Stappia sp. GBMRC 2046]|uniref:Potassium/proton antiporter n=1 Tax=Stappia sediminis TaxID=2692190 RepID=A0A7X3LV37_9HYPH|nr:potassium/proton antiporter [Stappia sediminis]MXN65598.1 potassium/proton antiporter [Stappia sediminis]